MKIFNVLASAMSARSACLPGPVSRRSGGRATALVALTIALAMAAPAWAAPADHAPSLVQHAASDLTKDLEDAVRHARPLVDRYGYAAAFAAMLVEGFGLPAPGQTLLMASALEAARGRLNIYVVLGLAVLAAVLGNSLGYLLGRYGGSALLRRLHVNEQHEAKIARLFERYGGSLVLFARFFDGLRQLNGIVAGALRMRVAVFMVFNVAGAMLYVGVWGFGTFYLSEHLPQVYAWVERVNPWVAGAAVLALVAVLWYLFRGREPAVEAPSPPPSPPQGKAE